MVDPATGTSQAPMAELGAIIAQARTRAGLLQAELADALGVQQSSVSQWERDQSTPTLVLFRRMVAVLGPWPLLAAVLPPPDPRADGSVDAAGDAGQAWWPAPEELARLLGQLPPELAVGDPSATPSPVVTVRPAKGLLRRPRRGGSGRPSPAELAQLVAEGHSDKQIGQRYQVTAETVAKWRKADGLRRQRRPVVERAEVLELRQAGLTATTIAAELGCSPSHVYRVARSSRTRQVVIPPPASSHSDQPARPAPNASSGDLATPPVVAGDHGDPAAAVADPAQQPTIPPANRWRAAGATRGEAV